MTDKAKNTKPADEFISLKALCTEMKIDPRDAREKLRLAVKDAKKYPELVKSHAPRQPWQWVKDSASLTEAKKVLSS